MLKACLNGPRTPDEHPALPITARAVADDAAAAALAGVGAVHVHPKTADGRDTLDAAVVGAVVSAIRRATPGLPVGVTTGAWIAPDPADRRNLIDSWTVLPDFASVNWHEPGAVTVAELLTSKGIGVEAGLFTPADVHAWRRWPGHNGCLRVLLELDTATSGDDPLVAAGELLDALVPDPATPPALLHGGGAWCWPVLAEAARRGLDTRIGLEDVLVLPDGEPARHNIDLISAALDILGGASRPGRAKHRRR